MPMADPRDSAAQGVAQREIAQSRRALLGMTAALGATSVVTAAALAGEQDPHLAWEAELTALNGEMKVTDVHDTEAMDALFKRIWAMEDRIGFTPALTLAGIVVQLRCAIANAADETGSIDIISEAQNAGLRNALATLDRLAGRA